MNRQLWWSVPETWGVSLLSVPDTQDSRHKNICDEDLFNQVYFTYVLRPANCHTGDTVYVAACGLRVPVSDCGCTCRHTHCATADQRATLWRWANSGFRSLSAVDAVRLDLNDLPATGAHREWVDEEIHRPRPLRACQHSRFAIPPFAETIGVQRFAGILSG